MKNFAHRGFSGKYPENTRIAFEMALEVKGLDGIENDVHLTKDGEVVIIHDERIDRTSVNKKGFVKDLTLEELREADLSYVYAGRVEPQRIMTLRDYLALVKNHDIVTNIELKTGVFTYDGIEQKVWDLIREADIAEKIIISSFNHYSVLRMKETAPSLECGLLTDCWVIDAGAYVKAQGCEYYHPEFHNCTKEIVSEIHSRGVGVNTWTVNEEADIRAMIEAGVDCVIGNFPDKVEEILGER